MAFCVATWKSPGRDQWPGVFLVQCWVRLLMFRWWCWEIPAFQQFKRYPTGNSHTFFFPGENRKIMENHLTQEKSGQIITTSAEVTLNGGLVRESPPNSLNSGLGIILLICPEKWRGDRGPGFLFSLPRRVAGRRFFLPNPYLGKFSFNNTKEKRRL